MSDTTTAENATAAKSANGKGQIAQVVADVTLDSLRGLLQEIGYRVEAIQNGPVQLLRSATSGLAFDIRPGSSFADGRLADYSFVTLFTVRGNLPLELVNRWNLSRRFGRLFLDTAGPDQGALIFCYDVSVAGGVTTNQLRAHIEIWDSLIQQLVPWLREEVSKVAPAVDTASADEQPAAATA